MSFRESFLTPFLQSPLNPAYLAGKRGAGNKAWQYFFLLSFALGLLQGVFLVARLPQMNEWRLKALDEINKLPDFQVEAKNKELTVIGITQPFVWSNTDNGRAFKVIIDTVTTTDLNLSQLLTNKDESGILIARRQMEILARTDGKEDTKLSKVWPDFKFTRQDLLNKLTQLSSGLLYAFSGLVALFSFLFILLGGIARVLLMGLLVWFLAGQKRSQWTFGEVFTVGLYAVTWPALISMVLSNFGIYIPMIYSVLLFIVMFRAVAFGKSADNQAISQS